MCVCACQSIEERETKNQNSHPLHARRLVQNNFSPKKRKTHASKENENMLSNRFAPSLVFQICAALFRMLVCVTPLHSFRAKVETDEVNPDRWDCCNARLLRLGRRMYGPALVGYAIVQFVSLVAVARLLNSGAEIDRSIEHITMGSKRCCNIIDRQLIVAFRSRR
jgi:hypothetical protein